MALIIRANIFVEMIFSGSKPQISESFLDTVLVEFRS